MKLATPTFESVEPSVIKPEYATRQDQRRAMKKRGRDRKADAKLFVSWDGEGVTLPDGTHVYILLANSTGTYIMSRDIQTDSEGNVIAVGDPLTTKQCVKFILNTARQNKGVNHVWFAFTYDVNMIIGDLPRTELEELYERGGKWTYCQSVSTNIQYRPKKTFALRSHMVNKRTGAVEKSYVKMDDTFTFFGCSFIKACDTYLGKVWPDRDLVLLGKSERASGFNTVDVLTYCLAELRAHVMVMEELRERLSYVGVRPRDWHGPGALASKVLQMHNLTNYTADMPKIIDLPLRHSYAGGWFELFRYGSTDKTTYRYDKRSAYPHAATLLTTAQGKWKHHLVLPAAPGVCDTEISDLGIYRCEWHCDYENEKYPQPFHYRSQDGHISYPPHVQGWYWGTIVKQAQRLPYGKLSVREGWLFTPDNSDRPFAFIHDYYDERRRLLEISHPAQLALKLLLNSIYGKLIQQIGWSFNEDGELKLPPYFNLFWASQITARTRAELLKLVIDNDGYDDVISFETDAVFTSREWTNVTLGVQLGEWEEMELNNLVYLQSGVYATKDSQGVQEVSHVRGMTKIVWPDDPVQTFRDMLSTRWLPYKYELTAFVGLGSGLRCDITQWRRWITVPRRLQTMEPSLGLAKRNHDPLVCTCGDDDELQNDVWHTTRVYPAIYRNGIQRAYDIEWDGPIKEVFDSSELVFD